MGFLSGFEQLLGQAGHNVMDGFNALRTFTPPPAPVPTQASIVRYNDNTLRDSLVPANRAAYGDPNKINALIASNAQNLAPRGHMPLAMMVTPAEGGSSYLRNPGLSVAPTATGDFLQGSNPQPQTDPMNQLSYQRLQGSYRPIQPQQQLQGGSYLSQLVNNFNMPSEGDN